MEELTTKFAEYICDCICGKLDNTTSQEEADEICDKCKMAEYIIAICNKAVEK